MASSIQKEIFLQQEADAWFQRSRAAIDSFDGDQEVVSPIIKRYRLQPQRILEIGCSAGHRLAYLKKLYPAAQIVGIDPSELAINYGREKFHFTNEELITGTADDLSKFPDGYFDLIIVGFVFYVIDRDLLFSVLSGIDRVLCNKGLLISVDFYAIRPIRRSYHHIKQAEVYSYKQRYYDILVSSHAYHLLAQDTFSGTDHMHASDDAYNNNYTVVLLKKDNEQAYI